MITKKLSCSKLFKISHRFESHSVCLLSLRPTVFDSSYCYAELALLFALVQTIRWCCNGTFVSNCISLHLAWCLQMSGIGIYSIVAACPHLSFSCHIWVGLSQYRTRLPHAHCTYKINQNEHVIYNKCNCVPSKDVWRKIAPSCSTMSFFEVLHPAFLLKAVLIQYMY